MSQEVAIFRICDHFVTEDLLFINSDFQSISINRPIGSQKNFELKRDGFVIPTTSRNYGYSLAIDPNNNALQVVQFKKLQQSSDDFFELSYYTVQGWCPKCNTLNVYFDWVFDNSGRLVLIKNEQKLLQDVIKGTLTIEGSNTYHTWYGTVLQSLIGGKIANFPNLQVLLGNDVRDFINNLKSLQAKQALIQTVTPQEMINNLVSINVSQNPANPDLVEISIIISNVAGDVREITRVINQNNQLMITGNLTTPLLFS